MRLADGAVNPYLMPAVVLAAGLDGMAHSRDPGKMLNINMYTDGHSVEGAKKLPLNLLDALRSLEQSSVLHQSFPELICAYLKLKKQEWNEFARHLTDWEKKTTLDC